MKITESAASNPKTVDAIERSVYEALKPYGFKKHGRTLHRFMDEDISQAITFQLGQAYLEMNHLLFVNVGIRVPECMTRRFTPEERLKKYYHDYECNIRSRLGRVEGREESCYDLRQPVELIIADILRQILGVVLPVFEVLNSRDAILAHRREYPDFDLMNSHLILLEETMIYGRRGEPDRATECFQLYYRLFAAGQLAQKDPRVIRGHLRYVEELAAQLRLPIPENVTLP